MKDKFNSLMGKTVGTAELVTTRRNGCDDKEILTVVFTDGSVLTVCEGEPDHFLNGLDVFISKGEKLA